MQDRYLVQFLRIERDPRGYWVTDCAFQEGQLDRAIAYVNLVLATPSAQVSAGLVLDQADGPGAVHYSAGMHRRQADQPEDREQAAQELENRLQAIIREECQRERWGENWIPTTGGEL